MLQLLDEIPPEIVRIVEAFYSDPQIEGLFLTGSYAESRADEYSDIDLWLVTQNGFGNECFNTWAKKFAKWPEVRIVAKMDPPKWFSFLLTTKFYTRKVDLDFVEIGRLAHALGESFSIGTGLCNGIICFEIENKLSDAVASFERVSTAAESRILERFLIHCWSGYQMWSRGELWECFDILNHLRDPFLLRQIYLKTSSPFQNYRRIESIFPTKELNRLEATICGIDKVSLGKAMIALMTSFRDCWIENGNELLGKEQTLFTELLHKFAIQDSRVTKNRD